MIEVRLAENDELRQTFELDRLNESLASAVQVGTGFRQHIRPQAMVLELRHKFWFFEDLWARGVVDVIR